MFKIYVSTKIYTYMYIFTSWDMRSFKVVEFVFLITVFTLLKQSVK